MAADLTRSSTSVFGRCWDEEILAEELGLLFDEDIEFDVGITGFSIAEVDILLEENEIKEAEAPAEDYQPDVEEVKQRCQLGDVWQLGSHRLICGDALDVDTIKHLMDGEKAQMVFTDPPYNVPIDGHVGGSGKPNTVNLQWPRAR